MRYPNNATPLILVGRQRAGTRFLTGALNKYPEIAIQGELPNVVMGHVQRFIDETDEYYRTKAHKGPHRERSLELWLEKKEQLIFSIWANASQTAIEKPGKHCRYFGYKRPNNEFYFSFYEQHFTTRKPLYIYCARNFVDNYLSIISRWPERSIKDVANDYLASIKQYRVMKREAPDRVRAFVLDRYITEGVSYLADEVIDCLDVADAPEILEAIGRMKSKNSTESLNLERRKSLTPREEKFVARNPQLQREFESLLD